MSEAQALFPTRQAEILVEKGPFAEVTPIKLSPEQREEILNFEAELFEKAEQFLKIDIQNHTVFPGYFLTDEGWRMFLETYAEVDASVADKKKPETIEQSTDAWFSVGNVDKLEKDKRRKIANASKRWAKDKFANELFENQGKVDKVKNPERVSRIVNPDELLEKIRGLRQLKKEIKQQESETDKEAKKIILRLYRRYINFKLAEAYSKGVVLARQPNLKDEDIQALDAVRGRQSFSYDRDVLKPSQATRSLERLDKFLQGVGVKVDRQGYFETIPSSISEYIRQRAKDYEKHETDIYKRYQDTQLSAQDAKEISEKLLEAVGLLKTPDNPEGWIAEIKPRSNFSVSYRENGELVRKIKVPEKLNEPITNVFRRVVHEMGHVLRHANREALSLKLLEEFSTGRGEALSEAGSVWLEEEIMRRIFGMERAFRGTYYFALNKKAEGGSFKECAQEAMKASTGGQEAFEKLLKDEHRFKGKAKVVFGQTLRIFRAGRIPLDDKSGKIVNSEELAYHEPTAQRLAELGLSKFLFVAGIDLYSIEDLQRLGVLDWGKVKSPDNAKIHEVWEEVKDKY